MAVYERVRLPLALLRGRELGFDTWERINTDIYKHGICPKFYTAGFFRLKILHHQFHLILTVLVGKNTKNAWKWRNLHRWQKFYTWQNGYFCQKICQSSFSFGKRLFRVSASGEWLSTGNGKEYFRPDALRAVDWPSTPQTICPAGKGVPLHYELPATDGEIKVL